MPPKQRGQKKFIRIFLYYFLRLPSRLKKTDGGFWSYNLLAFFSPSCYIKISYGKGRAYPLPVEIKKTMCISMPGTTERVSLRAEACAKQKIDVLQQNTSNYRVLKAIEYFRADKIILGSDTPYVKDNLKKNIERVKNLPLNQDEKGKILGLNLKELLNI